MSSRLIPRRFEPGVDVSAQVEGAEHDGQGGEHQYQGKCKINHTLPQCLLIDNKVVIALTEAPLHWLLQGYDIMKMQPHTALHYQTYSPSKTLIMLVARI